MTTYRSQPQPCPICAHRLDAADPSPLKEDQGPPAPGDFTVCINCNGILCWDYKMFLHAASIEEIREAGNAAIQQLNTIRSAIAQMKASLN